MRFCWLTSPGSQISLFCRPALATVTDDPFLLRKDHHSRASFVRSVTEITSHCHPTVPIQEVSVPIRKLDSIARQWSLDCHGRNYTGRRPIRLRGIPEVGIGHH